MVWNTVGHKVHVHLKGTCSAVPGGQQVFYSALAREVACCPLLFCNTTDAFVVVICSTQYSDRSDGIINTIVNWRISPSISISF